MHSLFLPTWLIVFGVWLTLVAVVWAIVHGGSKGPR